MTTLLLVLLIAVAFSSPIILSLMTGRQAAKAKKEEAQQRHLDKLEDWRRQDEVAAKAEESAALLLKTQIETAEHVASKVEEVALVAKEAAKKVAEVASVAGAVAAIAHEVAVDQSKKLIQIHTLVNSNMTAAMENELDARKSYLVLLESEILRREVEHLPSSIAAVELIRQVTKKISELESQLADRAIATSEADAAAK